MPTGNFNVDFAANGVADNNAAAALNNDKDALGATAGNNASAGEDHCSGQIVASRCRLMLIQEPRRAPSSCSLTEPRHAAASDIVKSTDVSTIAALAGSTDAELLPSGQKSYSRP